MLPKQRTYQYIYQHLKYQSAQRVCYQEEQEVDYSPKDCQQDKEVYKLLHSFNIIFNDLDIKISEKE